MEAVEHEAFAALTLLVAVVERAILSLEALTDHDVRLVESLTQLRDLVTVELRFGRSGEHR